jgi:hypothetical protein
MYIYTYIYTYINVYKFTCICPTSIQDTLQSSLIAINSGDKYVWNKYRVQLHYKYIYIHTNIYVYIYVYINTYGHTSIYYTLQFCFIAIISGDKWIRKRRCSMLVLKGYILYTTVVFTHSYSLSNLVYVCVSYRYVRICINTYIYVYTHISIYPYIYI